ncbi:MAG TPA: electron transfer flavoprotein subunit beta/FixA family protein [Ktedonobacterales bacterium]|nr:electron transfer flavoprotein subunit beta/FixA family protein [Ktedonobacterales bacterium]
MGSSQVFAHFQRTTAFAMPIPWRRPIFRSLHILNALEECLVKIVVCMKETPSTTVEKAFGPDMRLERRKEDAVINPFDEYTIEEGLRQQEKHSGSEVIALCMGPATATENVRRALAMGADRGVLVSDPALAGSDAIGTARALAAALKHIGFDLALFGSAAADAYGGVVPSAVAEFLGLPLLSFAGKLDIDGSVARIERQAEVGYQVAEAATPALVSVVKSINEPRYPSMKGIMQAKKKPIDTLALADLGLDPASVGVAGAREEALSAEKVTTQRKGEIYVGSEGAAERIVAFLVEQKVL